MRWATAALAAASLLACSSPPGGEAVVTVFAASSLDAAFQEMAEAFEEQNPGTEVVLSLAGSQTLATQIVNGARADVFASADHYQMERAVTAVPPDVGPERFATNRLAIAVAEGNPEGIEHLSDLERDDLVVVLGAEETPVGRYSRRMLERAGVTVSAASREPDVGLVLTKVRLGEGDAGLVYGSDLRRLTDGVEEVAIPPEENVTATYPIAAWEHGGDGPGPASRFMELVLSSRGREVLRAAGFEA